MHFLKEEFVKFVHVSYKIDNLIMNCRPEFTRCLNLLHSEKLFLTCFQATFYHKVIQTSCNLLFTKKLFLD